MPGSVVIILMLCLLAGLVMLRVGLRGRRLNDHPVCAWCTFDLQGVYPESVTCPECGAGLKRDRAVRIGVRRRLPGLVLLGALLAAVPIAPIGAVAWALVTGTNVDAYKPLGLLLWEARHSDPTRLDAIAAEIQNRAMARKLDPTQYQRVIEATLDLQADTSGPWTEAWGDLIERAQLDGVIKPEQEKRFASQAAVFEIQARPTVQSGGRTPVRIKLKEARVGSSTSLTCSVRIKRAKLDGASTTFAAPERPSDPFFGNPLGGDDAVATFSVHGSKGGGVMFFGTGSGGSGELAVDIPASVAPGRHTLELELENAMGDGSMGFGSITIVNGTLRRSGGASDGKRVASKVSAPLRVVGPDQAVVRPIAPDAGTTQRLAQALRPKSLQIGSPLVTQSLIFSLNGEPRDPGDNPDAHTRFDVDALPVPVAFDVYCRAPGGGEWKLGELHSGGPDPASDSTGISRMFRSMTTITINGKTVTSSSSDDGTGRQVSGPWQGGDADRVDIILRPSARLAAGTLDLDSYFNGEIVIKDVPVVRDAPSELSPFGEMDKALRRQFEGTGSRQTPRRSPRGQPSSPPGKGPL